MTVIAYDGKSIATDQMYSEGENIVGYRTKLGKWGGGIWTSAGRVTDGESFQRWLNATDGGRVEAKRIPKLHKDFEGVFTRDGKVYEVDKDLVPFEAFATSGWGSGGAAASALMKGGMSAKRACEVVTKHNVYCGGPIDVAKVKK